MMDRIIRKQFKCYFILAILTFISLGSFAQKAGYLQINGKIRKDNKPEAGVTIQVSAPGAQAQTLSSKDNGSFAFNLDLQKNYTIKFIKNGLVTKVVEFNATVPGDQTDIIYTYEFNIDLFADVAGVSQEKAMNKPVAKFAYNPTYQDFEYDQSYSRQIQGEQEAARKVAEELNKQQERARLDSLNKAWNDSLVKVKAREAELMAQKAEQDRLNAEREKARQDSITRANAAASAAAKLAEREKFVRDSTDLANEKAKALAEAREKEKADSLEKARLEAERQKEIAALKEKERQDSIAKAQAAQARAEALAKEKAEADAKAKADAEALAKENARKDSLAKAELAAQQRAKQIADSTEKAEAAAKRAEELARIKEKEEKDAKALAEAKALERQKFVADSTSRAQALKEKQDKEALAAKEAAERLRAENELKEKEKLRQDSIAKVKAAELAAAKAKADAEAKAKADEEKRLADLAKEKARKDSLATAEIARQKAEAGAKAKAEAEARAKAEEEKIRLAQLEKNRQDSVLAANKAAKEKEEADRKAKAYEEIEAKKKLLAKAATKPEEKTTPAATTSVPKIIESDYKEGVTDETIKETNRTIYRTVVKKDGTAYNYQKVVYNWGGVFYFKNDNSMTELTFQQELKNYRAEIK